MNRILSSVEAELTDLNHRINAAVIGSKQAKDAEAVEDKESPGTEGVEEENGCDPAEQIEA